MPDVVVHSVFGRDVKSALPESIREKLVSDPYTFALFGPDVWFMYQPWKLREGRGRVMHTMKPGAFLMALADRARVSAVPDALFSYLAGFLCHYALDSGVHPYVIHVTEEQYDFPRCHMSFEHSLDMQELRRASLDRDRHPVTGAYFPACRLPETIRRDIDEVFASVYGWKNCWSALNHSCRRFRLIYRVIENRNGLFSRLTRLTKSPLLKSLSYSESHFNDMDVENREGREWRHSHDESVSSAASFGEMRAEALDRAVNMISAAYRYIFSSGLSRDELAGIIGNRSYLSGLDAEDPRNLKFSSLLPPQKHSGAAPGGDPS